VGLLVWRPCRAACTAWCAVKVGIKDAIEIAADNDLFVGPFGGDLGKEGGEKDGAGVVSRVGWAVNAHDVKRMVAKGKGDCRGASWDKFRENWRRRLVREEGGFDQDGDAAGGGFLVGKVAVKGKGAMDPPACLWGEMSFLKEEDVYGGVGRGDELSKGLLFCAVLEACDVQASKGNGRNGHF
jgi:hypothetical protein